MKNPFILISLMALLVPYAALSADKLSLAELLNEVFENNYEIKSYSEKTRAQKKLISSESSLSDPSIGFSRLDRGNVTDYLTIQQKIKFPTKYHFAAKAQRRLYESSLSGLFNQKLNLRKKFVGVYYQLYAVQKTIQLTKVNLSLVKDFARAAEKKYAARKSNQTDSMKAHFEMTQLELKLLNLEQEESSLMSKINSLLGKESGKLLVLSGFNLTKPHVFLNKIGTQRAEISKVISAQSPKYKMQNKKFESLQAKKSLAKWSFAPDFQLQYQKRISGFPEDSSIFSVNMTVPLWLWKNSAKASYASAEAMVEGYRTKDLGLRLVEEVSSLKKRLKKSNKVLLVYQTTLIPQAESSYRSSRSGYKAGTSGFLDLLDAERSLYSVKQMYYQALTYFVKDIVEIESILGVSVSNIHWVKNNKRGLLK